MNRFVDRAQRGSKRTGVIGALLLALLLVVTACGTAPAATQTPAGMDMDMSTPAGSDLATPTAPLAQATSTDEMVMATHTAEMAMATPATGTGDTTASPTTQPPESSPAAAVAEATPTTAAAGEAEVVEIQATLREWALDVSQTEVAAGKVRFVVGNAGRFPHNFAIRAGNGSQLARTPNFSSGDGAQVVEVELQPGTYVLYCALPGHEQQGQRAELVVR